MDRNEPQETRAQRLRHHTGRALGAAGQRAQTGAGRAYAYLMSKPPLQRAGLVLVWGGAALASLLILYILILIPLTPGISTLKQVREAKATTVVSSDGRALATLDQGLQERVKLQDISPNVVSALIATEDHRFYDHFGVDVRRTVGAVLYTLQGDAQGGSTITQQLARNMFPEEIGRSRNLNRKFKEIVTAIKIEATYSKPEILEAYLNTVPFLYNAFGIEMAARTYFDKSAARLDVNEAATLVGMLKGTNYYNPVTNPERSLARRNVVLGQMKKHGVIDEKRFNQLKKRPLRLDFARRAERNVTEIHFTAHVRKWLIQWADENDYNLQLDGLVVQTTLDHGLQQAALRAVERQTDALQMVADVEWGRAAGGGAGSLGSYAAMHKSVAPFEYFWRSKPKLLNAFVRDTPEYRKAVEEGATPAAALKKLRSDKAFMKALRRTKTRLEAGFVAMDPMNGEVRAWVGSRSFAIDQYDHVAQAQRQPGSTFKPIVYGAALENGMSPDRLYRDVVTEIKAGDGKVWRPTDMSGSSGAPMTMRDGLVFSKNTITAQVSQDVGVSSVVKLARDLGVRESKLTAVPSLALGTSPVTLLEMVSAYSAIVAQGQYRAPVFVKRILDRNGRVIEEFGGAAGERAMSPQSAALLVDMLRGVINRGTGTGVRYRFGITGDLAGKTGTTQNNTDGWFIMMHPNLVAGAWVGFNDNRVAMRSSYWGQGGHNALLLVGDFFKGAIDSGKLSTAAQFPGGRPLPPVRADEVPQDIMEDPGGIEYEGEAPPAEPELEEEIFIEEDEAYEVVEPSVNNAPIYNPPIDNPPVTNRPTREHQRADEYVEPRGQIERTERPEPAPQYETQAPPPDLRPIDRRELPPVEERNFPVPERRPLAEPESVRSVPELEPMAVPVE